MHFEGFTEILFAIGIPAVGAALLSWFLGAPKIPFRTALQALIFAFALAFSTFLRVDHSFLARPSSAFLSLAILVLAGFVAIAPRDTGRRYFLRAIVTLALMAGVLWPLRAQFHGPVFWRNLAAFFCLALGVWSIMEGAVGKVRTPAFLALPMIAIAGFAYVLVSRGASPLSWAAECLLVFTAVYLLMALSAPERILSEALLPFLSVYVILIMMAAHFEMRINPWLMIYLCFPYLILWIRGWFPFIPKQPLLEALFLSIISLLPLIYLVRSIETGHG